MTLLAGAARTPIPREQPAGGSSEGPPDRAGPALGGPLRRWGGAFLQALGDSEEYRGWLRWAAWVGFGLWLLWGGLIHAPGPHDNDWPMLMWLVKHASWHDPSPLAIGHYGPAQLLLVWWLYPLFGSTLATAKVLSTLGVLTCIACAYRMTRARHGEVAAVMAALTFALSTPAFEAGQSEFADAPASAAFFSGLYLWWKWEDAGRGRAARCLLAGVVLGISGLMRTHFVVFSCVAAACAGLWSVLLPGERSRGSNALAGACFLLGALLGNLPGFALNYYVHGRIGSAVASTFVGQVLYGYDELDLLNTYARYPLDRILREHPLDIVNLMTRRAGEHPALWALPLISSALVLWKRRVWHTAVVRQVLLCSTLAFLYFWLFVSLSWVAWPRVLLPVVFLDGWLLIAVGMQLFWARSHRVRLLWSAAFALGLAIEWSGSLQELKGQWRITRVWWRQSTELVQELRREGMKDARQAFVFDWNRFVVDDPQLQPFYNFGFWNLLLPEFREERPIPTRHLNDLSDLASFFENNAVRFFVLPKDERRLRRFPALIQLVEGKQELPGFRRGPPLSDDVLLVQGE